MGNITVEYLSNSVATITCHSVANPAPVYTWTKGSSVVLNGSGKPASDLVNNTLEVSVSHNNNTFNNITITNVQFSQ